MVRGKVTLIIGSHQAKMLKRLVQYELQDKGLSGGQRTKLTGLLGKIKSAIKDSKGSEVK